MWIQRREEEVVVVDVVAVTDVVVDVDTEVEDVRKRRRGGRCEENKVVVDAKFVDVVMVDVDTEVEDVRRRVVDAVDRGCVDVIGSVWMWWLLT
ncbi:hypothetical protein YC2023_089132 [Brassica napus]